MSQKVDRARGYIPTVLTILGAVGVIVSCVLTAKETPKAVRLLEEKENPSLSEKVKTVAPAYLPAAISATASIACILGANHFSKKEIASLASLYLLGQGAYTKYKDKVKEVIGKDGEVKIRDFLANEKVKDVTIPEETILFYEEFSETYFFSTIEYVHEAEYELNRDFVNDGFALLNTYLNYLGIEKPDFGYRMGWTHDEGEELGYNWIDIVLHPVTRDDGKQYYVIEYANNPTYCIYDWKPAKYADASMKGETSNEG